MRYKKLIVTAVTLSVFCGAVVMTSNTHATSVTDEINVTIPASCSLTSVVGSAHTATIETGVYQENIGETTFKVFCNDSEGFSVYAVGFTNDEFGNNTLKPAIVDNSNAMVTGTATSGNTSNWAMKLSAVSGTYAPTIHSTEENSNTYSFTNYHAVPSEYIKVASYSSNTDVTTGSSFKSTYAAFISQTQLADSYTGKVKYTVVHPSSELAPTENIAQLTYMQDFKDLKADERTAVLNSMQYNTTYNLIDSRDNKTYQIARLKDNNIWMAENLDLGRTELTQDLTSQNTNLSETVTAETFNGWVKTAGTDSYTSAELISVTGIDSASQTPYGTLYNYCATTAETICATSYDNDAQYDICPAGWRLPTGNNTGEFKSLYSMYVYNSNSKIRAPIENDGTAFALAGSFNNGSASITESMGHYWSSTAFTGIHITTLYLTNINYPDLKNEARSYGFSVRCIAKRPFRALTISYGAGVASVQINGITVQNGGMVNLEEGISYSATVTPAEGYALSDWTSTSGSIKTNNTEATTYTISSENAVLTPNTIPEIQNIKSSNCTSTASKAKDNRDGHVYTIQRLADGRCWMMENLDLGRTTLEKDLTSANTNLITTITASTFNSWKKSSNSNTYESGEFIPITTSNSSNGLDTDPTSGTPYGTLYNYCATSANTICTSSNNDNASYDICPARWRLPTGGLSGEYNALRSVTEYNDNYKLRKSITSGGAAFALAGRASGTNSNYSQGTYGLYWSSTIGRGGDMTMSSMYFNDSSYFSPQESSSRGDGHTIRCILDETSISDLTYMQDFKTLSYTQKKSVFNSMDDNTVYSLTDNRDNTTYQIVKLKDGNIWMAENLNLGHTALTNDLTNLNTNLETTVNATTFNSWIKSSATGTYTSAELIPLTALNTSNGLAIDQTTGTPYGTLYNYCATSAGTICSNSNNSNAQYDICPAGWRLPTGGYSGNFQKLYSLNQYNSAVKMRAPIAEGGAAFVLAGSFYNSAPNSQGSYGLYWTSTVIDEIEMYRMVLEESNVSTTNVHRRYLGSSVRCLVK